MRLRLMSNAYTHGTHSCTLCHTTGTSTTVHEDRWRLEQWPAYWGDSNPDVLVLGFSMGANQVRAAREKPFDQVAFAGLRVRLRQVLECLGVPLGEQTMDQALSAQGKGLGFASLSRCSLGLWDGKAFKTSGTIMKAATSDPFAGQVLVRCANRFLPVMPASVRRVVLLGVGDDYVRGVRQILRKVFDDFADTNSVAFRAGGRTWVFAVHPSKPNRVEEWLEAPAETKSGAKREHAKAALLRSYQIDEPVIHATTIGRRRLVKQPKAQDEPALAGGG